MTERPKVPLLGGEREILTSQLDLQRSAIVVKCSGLTDEQARRVHLPSELTTVAGLLAHLRLNEWYWFSVVLGGEEDVWKEKFEQDPDVEFRLTDDDTMEHLLAAYDAECERSRELLAKVDLDHVGDHDGREVNARWVAAHMIEETARHAGHLDVLRELTDGVTGL
jgi:uncharacterized damage-inducible protein DinB